MQTQAAANLSFDERCVLKTQGREKAALFIAMKRGIEEFVAEKIVDRYLITAIFETRITITVTSERIRS